MSNTKRLWRKSHLRMKKRNNFSLQVRLGGHIIWKRVKHFLEKYQLNKAVNNESVLQQCDVIFTQNFQKGSKNDCQCIVLG